MYIYDELRLTLFAGHKRAKTEVQQPVLPSQLIMESNIAAELAKPAPTRAAAARTNQVRWSD